MEVNIDFLSPKATNKIFKFLENSTLLQMREVGSSNVLVVYLWFQLDQGTKEIVDNLLIINQTQINELHIVENVWTILCMIL